MTIKKVKLKERGAKIHIEYSMPTEDKNGTNDYTLTCVEPPLPSFGEAFKFLASSVIELCEFPTEYANRVHVTGVSFSESDDTEGVVITAQMSLVNSDTPLNLNTPYKKWDDLNSDCARYLDMLSEEAERYVKGERAQGELFGVEVRKAS